MSRLAVHARWALVEGEIVTNRGVLEMQLRLPMLRIVGDPDPRCRDSRAEARGLGRRCTMG